MVHYNEKIFVFYKYVLDKISVISKFQLFNYTLVFIYWCVRLCFIELFFMHVVLVLFFPVSLLSDVHLCLHMSWIYIVAMYGNDMIYHYPIMVVRTKLPNTNPIHNQGKSKINLAKINNTIWEIQDITLSG